MSVKKRGKHYYVYFRPFGDRKVGLKVDARGKKEAEEIERMILRACRSWDFSALAPEVREPVIRLFRNQSWELPEQAQDVKVTAPEEMTLWKAILTTLKYPGVKDHPNRSRLETSFTHIVEHFGRDYPVKSMWIPEIKRYQVDRLAAGAAESTVNKEKSALSRMFQILVELRYMGVNPAREVRNLNEKSGERQVYVGYADFHRIVEHLPAWFKPIALTAYFTGCRRGEIVKLTRKRLKLDKRMIYIGPDDCKEGNWKRVPAHRELVPILEDVLKVQAMGTDRVFLKDGEPIDHRNSFRWCWEWAVKKMGFDPPPTYRDIRHAWLTNARRSGVDHEIRQMILGHSTKQRGISERYGFISDDELLKAIDLMTFDHGDTMVWIAREKKTRRGDLREKMETKRKQVASGSTRN